MSTDLLSKLQKLEKELNHRFLERSDAIRAILLSLLVKHHALIFGKHGAAKSDLIRTIASTLDCGCFSIQLGADTKRDEVFGMLKPSSIMQDQQCYAYQNFLPGQPIVFLDEIDKTNSIIKNALYTAMEERQFLNDGKFIPIPLVSLFGAANRIEQLQSEALAPLLDRFLFRVEVDWIGGDANFLKFLSRVADHQHPPITTQLSLDELKQLQTAVQQVQVPQGTIESLVRFKKAMEKEGIFASTRRWGYTLNVLKAHAFISVETSVDEHHFPALKPVLWSDTRQLSVIERTLKPLVQSSHTTQISTLLQQAQQMVDQTLQIQQPQTLLGSAALTVQDLKALRQELESRTNRQRSSEVQTAIARLTDQIEQVEHHCQQVCQL